MLCLYRTLFPPDRPEFTRQMFSMAEVSPDNRSFHLSMEEFDRLCHVYKHICDQHPELFQYDYRAPENAMHWQSGKASLGF